MNKIDLQNRIKLLIEYNQSMTSKENKIKVLGYVLTEQPSTHSWNQMNSKPMNYYEKNSDGTYTLFTISRKDYFKKFGASANFKKEFTPGIQYIDNYLIGKMFPDGKLSQKLDPNGKTTGKLEKLDLIGPYNDKDILWYENKIIIPKDGQGESKVGAFYILKNSGNTTVTVNSIQVSNPELMSVVITNKIIKPGKSSKILITLNDLPSKKNVKEQSVIGAPNMGVTDLVTGTKNIGNGYVVRNAGSSSSGKYKAIPFVQYPKLNFTIKTDKGDIPVYVNASYSKEQELLHNLTEKYKQRITPKYNHVPKYFSVYEYDDFIKQLEKIPCYKNYGFFKKNSDDAAMGEDPMTPNQMEEAFINSKKRSYVSSRGGLKTSPVRGAQVYNDGGAYSPNDREPLTDGEKFCISSYKKLYETYRDEHFPNGITQDEKKIFYDLKSKLDIEKSRGTLEKGALLPSLRGPGSSEWKTQITTTKELEALFGEYGYDARTSFDRFMDSGLGQVAQMGAFVVLALSGFITEGATWAVAAELLLNLGLGTYYTARGNTREALVWFIFAGLGRFHNLYKLVEEGVSKYALGESVEVISSRIASKLSNVSLSTAEELKTFMYSNLSRNERAVFRETLKQSSKDGGTLLIKELETFSEEIAKGRNVWKEMSWADAAKLRPATAKFAKNTIIDMAITIPLVQELYDKLKTEFKKRGLDITWGEKDNELLEKLAETQSESELRNIFSNYQKVLEGLSEPAQAYYVDELNKLNKSRIEEVRNMSKANVVQEKKELEIKLVDETKKNPELTKKYYEHGSPENIKKWEALSKEIPYTGWNIKNGIKKDLTDYQFLKILKNKNYDENDIFFYSGNNSEILKIYNSDEFEDVQSTPENDKKPKNKQ